MTDSALFTLVEQQLESFGDTYFEAPPVNRFEQFLPGGHDAFPVLFDVLTSDAADEGSRTEALLGIGRIFDEFGPTPGAVDAVVKHAKLIATKGLGPEREATFFALGRARDASLLTSMRALLERSESAAVLTAAKVLGYAGDHDSVDALHKALSHSDGMAANVVIWALGEIGDDASCETLIDALGHPDRREAALKAIVRLAPVDALDPIVSSLEDLQGSEAIAGAMALRSIVLVHKDVILEDTTRAGALFESLQNAASTLWPPASVLCLATAAELGRKVDPSLASKVLGVDLRAP